MQQSNNTSSNYYNKVDDGKKKLHSAYKMMKEKRKKSCLICCHSCCYCRVTGCQGNLQQPTIHLCPYDHPHQSTPVQSIFEKLVHLLCLYHVRTIIRKHRHIQSEDDIKSNNNNNKKVVVSHSIHNLVEGAQKKMPKRLEIKSVHHLIKCGFILCHDRSSAGKMDGRLDCWMDGFVGEMDNGSIWTRNNLYSTIFLESFQQSPLMSLC